MLDGTFDERFLRLPERVIVTTMQSHQRYFPLGGNRFAFVANGGDPDVVRAGQRVRARGPPRGRGVHVRARRRGRDRRARRARRRRSRSSTGGGHVRRQGASASSGSSASSAATSDAVEAARLAKADQAAELVREFPELEGHIGATYARLAGLPGRGRARDRRAVPAGQRRRPAAALDGRARCSPRPTSSTHLRVAFGLGKRRPAHATRSACGGPRSASAGSRSKAACPSSARCCRTTCATSSRSGSRACSTCRSSSCARRARPRQPTSAASPSSRERCTRRSARDEFASVYEAYDRAHRLAGKRDDAADAVDASALRARHRARALRRTARAPRARPGRLPTTRCAARPRSRRSSRASSTT